MSIEAFAFSDTNLAGTLAVPNTVTTIGNDAFADTNLARLDLSKATSLVEIGKCAFSDTNLAGTLSVPNAFTKISPYAFYNTKLTGLDLSKATSLVRVGDRAFAGTPVFVKGSHIITMAPLAFCDGCNSEETRAHCMLLLLAQS